MNRRHDDMPDDWRMDDDDGLDGFRGIVLAMRIMAWAAIAILIFAFSWPAIARGQTLVDMTRYDYTQGPQMIECYLNDLHYDCTDSGCTAVIVCHSQLDGIFTNGFES